MAQSVTSRLEQFLWPKGYRRDVWMIVDSARDPRIFGLLLDSYLEHSCLYSGAVPRQLEGVAPYLVQLEYEDPRTQRFLEQAWGNSWGIFIKCDTRLQTLRRHLRHFLTVRGPDGKKLLFRYYDPRVLRVYLPSCSSEELRMMFGPIERFWMEGDQVRSFLEFGLDGNKLARNELLIEGLDTRPMLTTRNSSEPPRFQAGQIIIRREQFAVFSQAEVKKFEDWVASHARKFFPRQCGLLGEARLRDTIQSGIQRAATHGFKAKRDVCKFIDLMIVFGRDFDVKQRWASEVLARPSRPAAKIASLFWAAKLRLSNR